MTQAAQTFIVPFESSPKSSYRLRVDRIYICKECSKPKAKHVRGKPLKGKKLIQAAKKENLSFKVIPCKCLGKCKLGPNGLLEPENVKVHRLSVKTLRKIGTTF